MKQMQRICAWCRKDLDTGQQLTDAEYEAASKTATHGVCQECSDKEINKYKGGRKVKFKVTWETDGENIDLPSEVFVPNDIKIEDVADYLSNAYGWLVSELKGLA